MEIIPITLKVANAFVTEHHRHHKPPQGQKFSIGVKTDTGLCGVVIVGRPVSRNMDDGRTAEITRMCTDGTYNACSILYGAAARAAQAMGYRRIITYILDVENGSSLKASGFKFDAYSHGGSWSRPSRTRTDKHPLMLKQRWSRAFNR